MKREDIIQLAREAGIDALNGWRDDNTVSVYYEAWPEQLERFAAIVEAHVNAKEKERQRYDVHSCGPDCDRYICVAVRNEREACAKVCEQWGKDIRVETWDMAGADCAAAIRARGNT